MSLTPYVARMADDRLERLFGELPALMLTGPRAAGKTTTARRHARTVVRLDREAEATAFDADPDSALGVLPEPVLLDEWQAVPGVLAAVKRAVDDDPRPGRFLMTGSVRADLLGETWPGTGRVVCLRMDGLTMREIEGEGTAPAFVERLATGEVDAEAASQGQATSRLSRSTQRGSRSTRRSTTRRASIARLRCPTTSC